MDAAGINIDRPRGGPSRAFQKTCQSASRQAAERQRTRFSGIPSQRFFLLFEPPEMGRFGLPAGIDPGRGVSDDRERLIIVQLCKAGTRPACGQWLSPGCELPIRALPRQETGEQTCRTPHRLRTSCLSPGTTRAGLSSQSSGAVEAGGSDPGRTCSRSGSASPPRGQFEGLPKQPSGSRGCIGLRISPIPLLHAVPNRDILSLKGLWSYPFNPLCTPVPSPRNCYAGFRCRINPPNPPCAT